LVLGGLTTMFIALAKVGWWSGLVDRISQIDVPSDYFNVIRSPYDKDLPWTGLLIGMPISSIWYWACDQVIVQRVLSAKSVNDAKGGAVLAGYIKLLPMFIMVVPGMIAMALYPDVVSENEDIAYPHLVLNILPMGVLGLMLAAMLSALMSSLASVFNSAATLFTMDVYRKFRKTASQKELLWVGRCSASVMVVLGIAWIPVISKFANAQLFLYINSIQGYLTPPITTIFIAGILWERANTKAAISTLAVGSLIGITRLILDVTLSSSIIENKLLFFLVKSNFMHFGAFEFCVCWIVMFVVTLVTKPDDKEVVHLTVWYKGDRNKHESARLLLSTNDPDVEEDYQSVMLTSQSEAIQLEDDIPDAPREQAKSATIVDWLPGSFGIILGVSVACLIVYFR